MPRWHISRERLKSRKFIAGAVFVTALATGAVLMGPANAVPWDGGSGPSVKNVNAMEAAANKCIAQMPASQKNTHLYRGKRGECVSVVQKMLNITTNAGLTTEGNFGPLTEGAVRKFQTSRGLAVDGRAGPQTLTKLKAEYVRIMNSENKRR